MLIAQATSISPDHVRQRQGCQLEVRPVLDDDMATW